MPHPEIVSVANREPAQGCLRHEYMDARTELIGVGMAQAFAQRRHGRQVRRAGIMHEAQSSAQGRTELPVPAGRADTRYVDPGHRRVELEAHGIPGPQVLGDRRHRTSRIDSELRGAPHPPEEPFEANCGAAPGDLSGLEDLAADVAGERVGREKLTYHRATIMVCPANFATQPVRIFQITDKSADFLAGGAYTTVLLAATVIVLGALSLVRSKASQR